MPRKFDIFAQELWAIDITEETMHNDSDEALASYICPVLLSLRSENRYEGDKVIEDLADLSKQVVSMSLTRS